MPKKKGQSKVTIYPDWCKGCGICAAFCPAKVMELGTDGKAHVVREEECVSCGFCELHCPDFAISVTSKVSSRRKSDDALDPRQAMAPSGRSSGPSPEENVATPNGEHDHGNKEA
jgi:2-oxoglutarate ferredoxin oxidoreductase subunit delta